jgi:hypothetical protein
MNPIFFAPPIEAFPYFWLVKIGSNKFGVHQDAGWYMKMGERLLLLDSEEKCVPLEPILEVDVNLFFKFLHDVGKESPAYAESIDRFPKVLLLKHVFHTSFSGYWPQKALTWLSADPGIQNLFQTELQIFSGNKVMPQGARQQAKRILQRLSCTFNAINKDNLVR